MALTVPVSSSLVQARGDSHSRVAMARRARQEERGVEGDEGLVAQVPGHYGARCAKGLGESLGQVSNRSFCSSTATGNVHTSCPPTR